MSRQKKTGEFQLFMCICSVVSVKRVIFECTIELHVPAANIRETRSKQRMCLSHGRLPVGHEIPTKTTMGLGVS